MHAPSDLSFSARFEASYVPEPNTGCWLWAGELNRNGYGIFSPGKGVRVAAHRLSYELERGMISNDLQMDHLCRVRCCVNPDHLEPVTPIENLLRSRAVNGRLPVRLPDATHCMHGHDLSLAGIYTRPSGYPECRACKRAARRLDRRSNRRRRRALRRAGGAQ